MNFKLNINDDEGMIKVNLINESSLKITDTKNIKESLDKKYSGNRRDQSAEEANKRSKREIKKSKRVLSMESENISESNDSEIPEEKVFYNMEEMGNESDIVMEGNLLYRYELDQIELEGFWSISTDQARERFSYLLLKNNQSVVCPIKTSEIDFSFLDQVDLNQEQIKKNFSHSQNDFYLQICSSNLFENLMIPHGNIFNSILNYLTGEYHGFFLYYNKTIEDRFYLYFSLEDNQVRINGEGTNSLGNFNIIGYINFYTSKNEIFEKNTLSSDVIFLGDFKLTRIYNAFNPNENYRVIKSYQHRKKNYDTPSDDLS